MHKLTVVDLQLPRLENGTDVGSGLFAYNEVPAFAVAKRLLVQGASQPDAPFFLAAPF